MSAPAASAGPSPAPLPPEAASTVFGDRLELARCYADLLAGDAVVRGLIGPREVPRLWDRHLLNCAVLADLLPTGARVVDVGSGAGLPGLALAVRRPDLRVDLVEPMQRRTAFLEEAVHALELRDSVRVVRGRADDAPVRGVVAPADWVVARAVAPLARLAGWCLPLLGPGGRLLAMKGARADEEATQLRRSSGTGTSAEVVVLEFPGVEPVRVVVVVDGGAARKKVQR